MEAQDDLMSQDSPEDLSSATENPGSSSTSGPDNRLGGTDADADTHANAATPAAAVPVRTRRKPMPRKGHTKSRKGCYQCKRRKVKCNESLPSCEHCQRIGLACEYPGMRYQRERNDASLASYTAAAAAREGGTGGVVITDGNRGYRGSSASSSSSHGGMAPAPMNALNASSPSFDMNDMRFYSHFILSAYPSLPIKGDKIWMSVSQMSFEYDFLMHSMLALGASHLTLCTSANFSSQALSHRVKAIQSLNKMLSKQTFTKAEGDAAFATLLTLTFQSSYMPEGMLDFIAMVRGCHVVTTRAIPDMAQSAFCTFQQEEHIATFVECVNELPCALRDREKMSGLVESIRTLGPDCKSTLEVNYLAEIQRVLQLCIDGDMEAFAQFTVLYSRFGYMPNEDFAMFSNTENYTAQVILAHFFLLDYLVGEATSSMVEINTNIRKHVTLMWIEKVAAALPSDFYHHIECPLRVARSIIKGTRPALPDHWPRDPVRASSASIGNTDTSYSGSAGENAEPVIASYTPPSENYVFGNSASSGTEILE